MIMQKNITMHDMKKNNHSPVKALRHCREHIVLWKAMNQQSFLAKLGFREYVNICAYTVEFCSRPYGLIVEIEGFEDVTCNDFRQRSMTLTDRGFRILRYESYLIRSFLDIVIEDIRLQSATMSLN